MKRLYCASATCLGVATVILILSRVFVPLLIQKKIREGIREHIVVHSSMPEDIYGRFLNNTEPGDPPSYMRFYFFNVTNLDDVRRGTAKPILEEVGPYTYRRRYSLYDIEFEPSGRVSFKDVEYFIEEPELTNGSFDDKITTLNMALVGALTKIENDFDSIFLTWLLQIITAQMSRWSDGDATGLFARRSVNDLLWGYQDPLLRQLKNFVVVDDNVTFLTNDTAAIGDDRINTMNTGLHDMSQLGQLEVYEGQNEYEWTNDMEQVRGTDGTRFDPNAVELGGQVDVWVGDLFRPIKLRASKKTSFSGVEVIRYEVDPSVWEPNQRFDQYLHGLMNITTAKKSSKGAPVYASLPHYCGAKDDFVKGVEGLSCDVERHTLFADIEPNTGFALRGAKRLMISSEFGPQFGVVEPNVKRTILPIFWLDGSEQANDDQLSLLKDSIYWAQRLLKTVKIATLVGSLAFGLLTILAIVLGIVRDKERRGWRTSTKYDISMDPVKEVVMVEARV